MHCRNKREKSLTTREQREAKLGLVFKKFEASLLPEAEPAVVEKHPNILTGGEDLPTQRGEPIKEEHEAEFIPDG